MFSIGKKIIERSHHHDIEDEEITLQNITFHREVPRVLTGCLDEGYNS